MRRILRRVRSSIPQGELSRGVLTLVAGTGVAQLIVILSSPALTRLYSPSDYGVFAVATSVMSVLLVITCLRYEFAILLPEADVAAANVLALSLVTAVAMSAVAGVVLWLAGPWLLGFIGAPTLGPYVMLIPLGQLGGGAVAAFTFWAVRTKTFSDIAATRLTQSGALVSVQIGLGLGGYGAPGLLVGDVAGRISGSTRLARAAWRSHASSFRQVSRAGILIVARRYRRFPILSSPSALLSTSGLQAPLLLLVALYGPQVGGLYALADRLCSLPLTLVAGAVGQVFIAEAARLAREQPEELRPLFGRTTRSLARTALAPAILLAVAAPVFAGPVFGSDWRQAGVFVAILSPMFYLTFVATATGDVLSVLERQDLHLARELVRFCLLGGPIILAAALGLPPLGAIVALSAAGCLNYSLYALFSRRAILTYNPHLQPSPATGMEVIDERLGSPDL
jgi:O-antigen/teichoic acid export membrane protein